MEDLILFYIGWLVATIDIVRKQDFSRMSRNCEPGSHISKCRIDRVTVLGFLCSISRISLLSYRISYRQMLQVVSGLTGGCARIASISRISLWHLRTVSQVLISANVAGWQDGKSQIGLFGPRMVWGVRHDLVLRGDDQAEEGSALGKTLQWTGVHWKRRNVYWKKGYMSRVKGTGVRHKLE